MGFIKMNHALDLFNELFYSTEIWGLLGVFLVVILIYFVSTKSKGIGALGWVMASLMAITYLEKGIIDAWFYNHAIILIFGGLFALIGGGKNK